MKFWEFWMENKDAITAIGILLTIIVSSVSLAFNYQNNKKVRYIEAITKNRIDWMYRLKEAVCELVKLVYSHGYKEYEHDLQEISNHFDELNKLQFFIAMQLNFKGEIEQKILKIVDEIIESEHMSYFYVHFADSDKSIDIKANMNKVYEYFLLNEYVKNYVEKNIFDGRPISILKDEIDNDSSNNVYYLKVLEHGLNMLGAQELVKKLQKELCIYFKFEWNRIKNEAKGASFSNKKCSKVINELYTEYDQIHNALNKNTP